MDIVQSSCLVMTVAMAVAAVVYGYFTFQQRRMLSEERRGFLLPNFMIMGSFVAITLAGAVSTYAFGDVQFLPVRMVLESVFGFCTGLGLLWIIGRRLLIYVYAMLFGAGIATETVFPFWRDPASYVVWAFASMVVAFAPAVLYIFVYRATKAQGRTVRLLFISLLLNYYAVLTWNTLVTGTLWGGSVSGELLLFEPVLAPVASMFVTFTVLMLVAVCIAGKVAEGWLTVAYATSFLGVFLNIFVFSLLSTITPASAIVVALLEGGTVQWTLNGWHHLGGYRQKPTSSRLLGVALLAVGVSSFLYLYTSTGTPAMAVIEAMVIFTLFADMLIAISVATAGRFLKMGALFAILASVPSALVVFLPEIEPALYVSAIFVLMLTLAPSAALLRARGAMSDTERSKTGKIAYSILLLGFAQLAFFVFALPASAVPEWARFLSDPYAPFAFVRVSIFLLGALLMYDALRPRLRPATAASGPKSRR